MVEARGLRKRFAGFGISGYERLVGDKRVHAVHVRVTADGMTGLLMFPGAEQFEPVTLTVDVREEEPLRSVVMPAVEPFVHAWLQQAGLSSETLELPLAVGDDDSPYELGQGFVVDAAGRAHATYRLSDEPLENLVRAFERGLIPADPHAIRVLLRVPTAGVGGPGWESFEAGVRWFAEVWVGIGAAYAPFPAVRFAVEKFQRAAEHLLRHKSDLEERGFAPPDPVRLARAKCWSVNDLAEVLGTSPEEATDLLVAFGFEEVEGGEWQPPAEPANELGMILLGALNGYEALKRDEGALAERLRRELDAWAERHKTSD